MGEVGRVALRTSRSYSALAERKAGAALRMGETGVPNAIMEAGASRPVCGAAGDPTRDGDRTDAIRSSNGMVANEGESLSRGICALKGRVSRVARAEGSLPSLGVAGELFRIGDRAIARRSATEELAKDGDPPPRGDSALEDGESARRFSGVRLMMYTVRRCT